MYRSVLAALLSLICTVPLTAGTVQPAAAAEPTSGPCRQDGSGPTCLYWYGQVDGINDGDGLDVDVEGDGTNTPVALRMNGLNAMELTTYSNVGKRQGDCHAVAAANRLQQLIPVGTRVRLSAQYANSNSGGRPRRTVFFRDSAGTWRDVTRTLLAEGHALWLPAGDEPAHNAEYNLLAQQARAAKYGIWRNNACGDGPNQTILPQIWANWDANGIDGGTNLNGEYVIIKNPSATTLPVGGWYLRDSAYRGTLAHGFVFPQGASIAPRGAVTVYVGSGTNTTTNFFWRQTTAIFENASSSGMGDGAYLFDPQGDLRASMIYACRVSCSNPLKGKIALRAMYDPAGTDTASKEYVSIKNVSTVSVNLEGYQLWSRPYGHIFRGRTWLGAGETMRVYVGKGSATRLVKYWGLGAPVLGNTGDSVAIRSLTNILAACQRWGSTTSCRITD